MGLVLKIVLIVLIVIIITLIVYFINLSKGGNSSDRMSFRETLDLTGLPIVTFRQGNNKFNFILDTGASNSLIDSKVLDSLQYDELGGEATGYGVDGNEHRMKVVEITLVYKDKYYTDTFRVLDMTSAFGNLKKDYGVTVHGLLSSSFFERYKYVLDYNELIAYSKQ